MSEKEQRYRLGEDGLIPSRNGDWRKNASGYPVPIENRWLGENYSRVFGRGTSESEKRKMQREEDFCQGRLDIARRIEKIIDDDTKTDIEKLEQISRIREALAKSFGENVE